MSTARNWVMACGLALAVGSSIPAAAQTMGGHPGTAGQTGGTSGQTGGGTAGSGGQVGAGGQAGAGGQVGRSGGDLQKFVERAAIDNMAEIQLGQLAQQKAQDPEVKQFAQTMVNEHTQSQDRLQQATSAAGLSLPSAVDSKHQKMQDRLSSLSGADFDREYMKIMVQSHNDARKLLEKRAGKPSASAPYVGSSAGTSGTAGTAGTSGTSGTEGTSGTSGTTGRETTAMSSGAAGDIDGWAAQTLPDVKRHLQTAKDLEKRLKNDGKAGKSDKIDK